MRQLPVAFELVKQLPKMYDFRINAHVYTCLMAACIENRQVRFQHFSGSWTRLLKVF